MKVLDLSHEYKQYVIDLRRHFHQNPEPSTQEFETAKRIREELSAMGIPYEIKAVTGTVATIKGNKPGKTVALRADIDALQVEDITGVDYASKVKGMNHACGHDTHASMLLGAAKVLNDMKEEINGTVKLFFQPAEEMAVGAKSMIADGAMEGVDNVFAIHIMSGFDYGTVACGAGGRMASCDGFKILVHGKGGHGSAPHETVDAVYIAAQIVVNLQAIVSRMINPVDPAVVTCGSIHSGSRFNIIAQEGEIVGTTRCFSPKVRDQLEKLVGQVAQGIAATYGATIDYEYNRMAAPTVNEAGSVAVCEATVKELFGEAAYVDFPAVTGSEDAGEYFEIAPEGGCLAALGSRNKDKPGTSFPQHHPQYNVDEDAFEKGTALYAQYALNYLNKN